MKKWRVTGSVHASKYLGEFEAETEDEAIERALNENGYVSMCNQCADECSDPEVVNCEAVEIDEE